MMKKITTYQMCFHFQQGTAIGKCPKDKLFREYIGLELQVHLLVTLMPIKELYNIIQLNGFELLFFFFVFSLGSLIDVENCMKSF